MKTETHDKNATNADQLAVQNHQMGWYIETEKPNLNTRQRNESIMQFVESEKIWPPGCYARGLFIPPLREVLMRLPEQVFEFFEEHISFVLDCPKVKAWA